MLAFFIAILVSVGPLLRGSWDLWAQSLLFIAAIFLFGAWLLVRIFLGYLPLPSRRNLFWTAGLLALSGASAFLSPVRFYSLPAWRNLALGLLIFPAMSAVSKDGRAAIDEAIRFCAWILVLLAFYQHYHEHILSPAAVFPNPNVFAGAILLFLAISFQKSDWVLACGLILVLLWARSVGAWLGLATALALMRRNVGIAGSWLGAAIGLVCLVALYAKLQSPEAIHRWQWWLSAAQMAWDRPFLGFGPGAFAYVLSAYRGADQALGSIYAHEHFLETAAECGLPYLILWILGLSHCLRRGGPHKRFGALAILIQSLWDYPLSIAANFWLFCYFAASCSSETSRGINVPKDWKLPLGVLVLAMSLGLSSWSWNLWAADRLKLQAQTSMVGGLALPQTVTLLRESEKLADDPETERLLAAAELSGQGAAGVSKEEFFSAIGHLKRSAEINPYRASTWISIERLYLQNHEPDKAQEARRQGAVFCPTLRAQSATSAAL